MTPELINVTDAELSLLEVLWSADGDDRRVDRGDLSQKNNVSAMQPCRNCSMPPGGQALHQPGPQWVCALLFPSDRATAIDRTTSAGSSGKTLRRPLTPLLVHLVEMIEASATRSKAIYAN